MGVHVDAGEANEPDHAPWEIRIGILGFLQAMMLLYNINDQRLRLD